MPSIRVISGEKREKDQPKQLIIPIIAFAIVILIAVIFIMFHYSYIQQTRELTDEIARVKDNTTALQKKIHHEKVTTNATALLDLKLDFIALLKENEAKLSAIEHKHESSKIFIIESYSYIIPLVIAVFAFFGVTYYAKEIFFKKMLDKFKPVDIDILQSEIASSSWKAKLREGAFNALLVYHENDELTTDIHTAFYAFDFQKLKKNGLAISDTALSFERVQKQLAKKEYDICIFLNFKNSFNSKEYDKLLIDVVTKQHKYILHCSPSNLPKELFEDPRVTAAQSPYSVYSNLMNLYKFLAIKKHLKSQSSTS